MQTEIPTEHVSIFHFTVDSSNDSALNSTPGNDFYSASTKVVFGDTVAGFSPACSTVPPMRQVTDGDQIRIAGIMKDQESVRQVYPANIG